MEWLLLAIVYKSRPIGVGMSALARALDVSLPQITALASSLVSGGLISQQAASHDRRAKHLMITQKGIILIEAIENSMRGVLKGWLNDIPRQQLETYMLTVYQLAERKPA